MYVLNAAQIWCSKMYYLVYLFLINILHITNHCLYFLENVEIFTMPISVNLCNVENLSEKAKSIFGYLCEHG